MKKLYVLLLGGALLTGSCVYAQQDWVQLMKNQSVNVHTVQKAFNQWYKSQGLHVESRLYSNKDGDDEKDGNYMLFKRWQWFMLPRTYPSGNRPDMALIAKQYQDFRMHNSVGGRTERIQSTASWSYAGTANIPQYGGAGRVNRIRINPSNNNILYACSASGGLWVSTNGGSSWSTKTDHLPGLATSDVAIDPANTSIMYLATGDGDGIGGGFTTPSTIGVLKSTNGGNTWNPTGLSYTLQNSGPNEMTVNELLINPSDPNYVFAACSFGLYFSDNAGLTWNEISNKDFKDIAFEPSHPSIFYASTATGQFYRSVDGGMTLTQVSLPSYTGSGRIALAVTPADTNYVYVLADKSSNYTYQGLWLSKDDGQTFTLQSTSPNLLGFTPTGYDNGGQGWYTLSLAVSPTDADVVIVGGVNVWRSTNAGVNWTLNAYQDGGYAPYVHADIHHLLFVPGNGSEYYAACDGGLSRTTNSGTSWTDLSNGLEIAEQYCIGLSASSSTLWLTGWQDNGTNLANGSAWQESLGGDGMICFIDNTNNNYMYGEAYDGSFSMSSNGGNSWHNIAISTAESADWSTPWLQDPNASQTLYGGYENVWKSTNRGTNWAAISTWGTSGNYIVALAVAPSNSQYIYAATYGSIYATSNGGTSWTNVTAGLPTGYAAISAIAVDIANPTRLWVTLSGFSSLNKVYESDSVGTSWKNVSTGLPNLPVNTIVYQGAGRDAMYVGTDVGVYYRDTTNTGGTWVSYNQGLPNVPVANLKIYAPDSVLRAATYGRGTWQIATYTPAVAAPVAYFTAYPLTVCPSTSVQFTDSSSNYPTSWNWTFAGGTPSTSTLQNPVVTYSTAGTYQVMLMATNGNGSDTIIKTSCITVNPAPAFPTISQAGALLSCTPSNLPYYQWYRNNVIIPYDTVSQFWMSQTGYYKVVVANSYGCTFTSPNHSVTVLGVNDLSQNDAIRVYPNPTNNILNISFGSQQGNYSITLVNVLGQAVYSSTVQLSGSTTKAIHIQSLDKGVYVLSVSGKNTRVIQKVVIY